MNRNEEKCKSCGSLKPKLGYHKCKPQKHPDHICRFNDGEQECDCYDKGFQAGRSSTIAEIREAVKKQKYDEDHEDIGGEAIADHAYANKFEAFMFGYNQSTKELLDFLDTLE
jgi:hypothetical protein